MPLFTGTLGLAAQGDQVKTGQTNLTKFGSLLSPPLKLANGTFEPGT
jgi:hypothetical protein